MLYDDNFGPWRDIDDPETREFYERVQRRSVEKECSVCGKLVRLLPHYDKCDSCTRRIEQGLDW